MTKRQAANITVFTVFVSLLLLDILFYTGIFDGLDSRGRDISFTLLSQILCMGVMPYFIYKKLTGEQKLFGSFMYNKMGLDDFNKSVMVSFSFVFLNIYIAAFSIMGLEALGYTSVSGEATIMPNLFWLGVQLFTIACLPAIFEEFVFRGIVFNAYKDKGFLAVVISAVLFSFMHQNILQMIYTFVGGLVLGTLAYKTRSILAPMILHFGINAFSVLMSFGIQNPNHPFAVLYRFILLLTTNGLLVLVFFAALIFMLVYVIITLVNWKNPEYRFDKQRTPLTGYAFLFGSLVIGVLANAVSFYFGYIR